MFERWIEEGLTEVLDEFGVGCIAFSPLAQGMLTNKYLKGIPEDSRAAKSHGHLQEGEITRERLEKINALNELAKARGQSLAQMAIAWVARLPQMTSVLVGASSPRQLEENIKAINKLDFTGVELEKIENILTTE
jgi:L-glyceraldehyde 3-phosphate reductase